MPNPKPKLGTDLLFGANVVLSALQANKRKFIKAYIPFSSSEITKNRHPPARDEMVEIKKLLEEKNIPIESKYKYELDRLSENKPHNNVFLKASSLPLTQLTNLKRFDGESFQIETHRDGMERIFSNKGRPPLLVYLDSLWDPHNVGAVLRTCLYFDVDAVLYPLHDACPLNATVSKASAGALEWIPVFLVPHPVSLLSRAANAGWQLRMSAAPTESSATQTSSPNSQTTTSTVKDQKAPTLLVLGNEQKGVSSKLRALSHQVDWVPSALPSTHPWADSLNVSVATGILIHRLLHP